MALVIKLVRSGHKRNAGYSIVVVKKKGPGTGKIYEKLGYIAPLKADHAATVLVIKRSRLAHWLSKGALIHSSRIKRLLIGARMDR